MTLVRIIMKLKLKKMNKHSKFEGNGWIKIGLIFAVVMYIFNQLLMPYFIFKDEITQKKLIIGVPIWIIGGLLYGYIVKSLEEKKHK